MSDNERIDQGTQLDRQVEIREQREMIDRLMARSIAWPLSDSVLPDFSGIRVRVNCARTPCPHWTSSAPAGATWVCFEHRRELGPSAVEAAPERQRDTFADLADEWDLLPDVKP